MTHNVVLRVKWLRSAPFVKEKKVTESKKGTVETKKIAASSRHIFLILLYPASELSGSRFFFSLEMAWLNMARIRNMNPMSNA